MKKPSLLATNRYLKDRNSRERLLRRTILTSSAVEGVHRAVKRALAQKSPDGTTSSAPAVGKSEDHNSPG